MEGNDGENIGYKERRKCVTYLTKTIQNLSLQKLSVYANQWRFCSTRGIVYNTFFYFNIGSMDTNDITKQFLDVLTTYESISVCISGIVPDGGSGNEKFFFSIVDNYDLSKN